MRSSHPQEWDWAQRRPAVEDVDQAVGVRGNENHDDEDAWQRVEQVDGAHHQGVDAAAEEAGGQAVGDADEQVDGGGGEADARETRAPAEHAVEDVLAVDVAAEPEGDLAGADGGSRVDDGEGGGWPGRKVVSDWRFFCGREEGREDEGAGERAAGGTRARRPRHGCGGGGANRRRRRAGGVAEVGGQASSLIRLSSRV
jgi:hypothetical protein